MGKTKKRFGNMDDKTEMLKALATYSGPIKQCPPGGALGAGDLRRWAMCRAVGMSGVKARKRTRKLTNRMKLHQQFKASGLADRMTFQQWLSKPPSMRRVKVA